MRIKKPSRRDGRQTHQFIRRIPADLKAMLVGKRVVIPVAGDTRSILITPSMQSIRFSLKTTDPALARVLTTEGHAFLDQYFESKRSGKPIDLNHRQITALAGEFYAGRATTPDWTLNLDTASGAIGGLDAEVEEELLTGVGKLLWGRFKGDVEDDTDLGRALHDSTQQSLDHLVNVMLTRHGIVAVTLQTRTLLAVALQRQLSEALYTSARYAGGDYRPDENLAKIPPWEAPSLRGRPVAQPVPFAELSAKWSVEARAAGLSEATLVLYQARLTSLAKFLGHADARRVTPHDILRYKDHRLASTNPKTGRLVSVETVRTGDLAAFRSVFGWAVENRILTSNPAEGIKVKGAARRVKLRDRDFTDAEAGAILRAANGLASVRAPSQLDMLKRWAPWLCAYSGARIGEVVQLRKEDFRHSKEPDCWVMRITPEAGTVKDKKAREVPLHPHIVELGFPEFLKKAPRGYLFMTLEDKEEFRKVWSSRKTLLSLWVREYVPDRNVPPNHGWRHSFKSKGFEVDIQEKVLDAICGHAPSSEGRKYGSVTLKTKVDALAKFPRWDV